MVHTEAENAVSRRELDVSTVSVDLSMRERDAIEEMKRRTGINSDANLVRTALYGLAAHLESNIDTNLFRMRGVTKRASWDHRKRNDKRQLRIIWGKR